MRLVRAAAGIAALGVTLLGAALPGAADYRITAYPGPGTNVGDGNSGEDLTSVLARALAKATLFTSFEPATVTEGVTTRFVATVTYDKPAPGGRPIKVAYANEAHLTAAKGEFEIVPETDDRLNLDEGTRRPGGGYQLQWSWKVTPQQAGSLALVLEIQPVLLLQTTRSDVETRNKPIPVDVQVHPNRVAMTALKRAASGLDVTVADQAPVGRAMDITASLPLLDSEQGVDADLGLAPGAGSAAVTIRGTSQREAGRLVGHWSVTPTQTGSVQLVFTTRLDTRAGVIPLEDTVTVSRSFTALPAPPSFWSRLQSPFVWLGPVLAGVAGLMPGIRWLRRRWGPGDAAPAGTGPDGDPGAGGPGGGPPG